MFRHQLRSFGTRSKVGSGESRGRHRRRHWVLEGLENRTLLSGSPTIYTVDLTSDTGTGSDDTGDLLYCITQANANTNTAGSEIEFDPTVFQVSTQQSIALSATLDLSETAGPEVLDGPGASDLKITGNDTVEVFSVSSDTTASLSGLTIWGGKTNQDGGGINNQGTLTVTSCAFISNTSDGAGGGIANDGTLTITSSTFENNSASFGGGIENEGPLTVTGSTITSNTASFGGGIDNDESGKATLTSTTLTSNSASSFGGGIFYSGTSPLTVNDSTLSSNTAGSGGGIYDEGDGHDGDNKLTIANSTLSDNSANGGSSSSGGGGLYDRGATVSISGSTFSGNTATQAGGGIFSNAGALTITDSTIAGNSAGGVGAGIDENAGTLTSLNCTIADNTEPSTGDGLGGGLNIDQGTATLNNTIVALNTNGTGVSTTADNIAGTVSSTSESNLIGTGGSGGLSNGSDGNLVGVANPLLGALADNGGPTQTIALLGGSPAINAGNPNLASDLTTDQRGNGFPREVNGTVDIGAFEGTVTLNPTVYIVDLTSDTGVGSGNTGDLLYCVTQANANPNTAGSEIEFDPTVFATPQTIELTSTLELNEPAGTEVLDGPGASLVTVSGNNAVEVFQVASGATATLAGLTISDGLASFGGGIGNRGTLTVTDCTLSDNQATSGGGIDNSGSLTVTGGTIENNSAFGTSTSTGYGGGINNDGGTVTITGTTLASNQAADFTSIGGGIENNGGVMSITDSTLSDNSANGTTSEGGGIDNQGAGTLTIAGSTLSGNSAFAGSGGGIFNGVTGTVTVTGTSTLANTAGANGAGFLNDGTMTVVDSTIANNNAGGIGGGIDNLAGGTLSVVNSTLAGNSGFDGGGGIGSQGKLTALNCTIADNGFGNGGGYGGGIGVDGGTATLNNTIVALNTNGTGNAAKADDIDTIGGTVIGSFNLVGIGGAGGLSNGSDGNLVGVANPLLGALADNGGPTQTIALLAGSPAINAGNFALASELPTDQRGTGFPRVVGGNVDIGAFEVQVVTNNPVPTLTTISPNQIVAGSSNSLTLTVTGSGFVSQSVVDWNSTALATAYVSSTDLTATIPASDFATTGSFPVTVVNPTPGGGTSTAATVQVLAVPSNVYVNATYAGDPLGTAVTWTDGSQHIVGYDAFGTVQAGVTAVAPGGTVNIAPGTYTEAVSIAQSLTLAGAGDQYTYIQTPANFFASSDEIGVASGASVAMSGIDLAGTNTGVGIADKGGTLTATQMTVEGFFTCVAVQDHASATITHSLILSNNIGIIVGSSSSDTSTLTANNNDLEGGGTGVWNLQSSGSVNATLNSWGSVTGPTTSANPGGTGETSAGNVAFSPWLGDLNTEPDAYLVFSTVAGDNYVVTPIDGNTELDVTSGSISLGPLGTIPGISLGTVLGGEPNGVLGFSGNGGTVTINGETGSIADSFMVTDTSVQYGADDGLNGTTINFFGTGMTRDVKAEGLTGDNWFGIDGAVGSGPSGALVGDSGSNTFAFLNVDDTPAQLLGNIQGGGSSTLDYSNWAVGATVNLGNGTNGTASGVAGSVSGITAIIGSNNAGDNNLNAGSVPDVALTGGVGGGSGANALSGTGAGDNVVETLGSNYTLTNSSLLGTFQGSTDIVDHLEGIKVANLVGGNIGTTATFNVNGWTGTGSLTVAGGSVGTVTAFKSANFILTNTLLQTSDGMSLNLNPAIEWIADLGVGTSAGQPISTIDASGFSVGVTNLTVLGTGNAIVYGGSGGGTLTAAGSGNDVLIGNGAGDALTDTGTGRNILIGGGPGGDSLVGNGNDILVSGTTEYDSHTPDNIAALDAILGEWASGASYSERILTIKRGVRRVVERRLLSYVDAFNSHTIHTDPNANTLSDGNILSLQTDSEADARLGRKIPRRTVPIRHSHSYNWFIVSSHDHVTRRSNETETII